MPKDVLHDAAELAEMLDRLRQVKTGLGRFSVHLNVCGQRMHVTFARMTD